MGLCWELGRVGAVCDYFETVIIDLSSRYVERVIVTRRHRCRWSSRRKCHSADRIAWKHANSWTLKGYK